MVFDPRRARRFGRIFLARYARWGSPFEEMLVRNVSAFGLSVRSRRECPKEGESLLVELPDHELQTGTVRWVCGRNFGIDLKELIDPVAFRFGGKSWHTIQSRYDERRISRSAPFGMIPLHHVE